MLTNICCLNHTISKVKKKKFRCKQLNSISSSCRWKYFWNNFSRRMQFQLSVFWWRREARERRKFLCTNYMNSCPFFASIFCIPSRMYEHEENAIKLITFSILSTFQFLLGLFSFLTGISFFLFSHSTFFIRSILSIWNCCWFWHKHTHTNTLKWMSLQEENDRKQIRWVNDVK